VVCLVETFGVFFGGFWRFFKGSFLNFFSIFGVFWVFSISFFLLAGISFSYGQNTVIRIFMKDCHVLEEYYFRFENSQEARNMAELAKKYGPDIFSWRIAKIIEPHIGNGKIKKGNILYDEKNKRLLFNYVPDVNCEEKVSVKGRKKVVKVNIEDLLQGYLHMGSYNFPGEQVIIFYLPEGAKINKISEAFEVNGYNPTLYGNLTTNKLELEYELLLPLFSFNWDWKLLERNNMKFVFFFLLILYVFFLAFKRKIFPILGIFSK
jgi:hypothetical protein